MRIYGSALNSCVYMSLYSCSWYILFDRANRKWTDFLENTVIQQSNLLKNVKSNSFKGKPFPNRFNQFLKQNYFCDLWYLLIFLEGDTYDKKSFDAFMISGQILYFSLDAQPEIQIFNWLYFGCTSAGCSEELKVAWCHNFFSLWLKSPKMEAKSWPWVSFLQLDNAQGW